MSATVAEIITFIQAAHVGQHTNWDLDSRGGIILSAYPEQLKTRIVERALAVYPNALCVSDMNMRELGDMRSDLITQRYTTIGFLDYQKVWERDERTSSNVEGGIRALTDEGWQGYASNARIATKAKCFMVLCITPTMWEDKAQEWKRNGFARRMLFMSYRFDDRAALEAAIKEGHTYQLSIEHAIPQPAERLLYSVTESEAEYISLALKSQRSLIPLQLLLRVYNTLKWFYDDVKKERDRGMQLLMNMCPLLSQDGGVITLEPNQMISVVAKNDGTIARQRKPRKQA